MITLRPYQDKTLTRVRDAFVAGNRRVCLVLPTGSGKTVGFAHMAARFAESGKRVIINVHRDRLLTQASLALLEAGVPHGIIGRGQDGGNYPVHVCSINTLARRVSRRDFAAWLRPDLIIDDECHHVVANSWAAVRNVFPYSWMLGVTATPERLDGRGLGDVYDDLVVGPTSGELIESGWLKPYEVYAPPSRADLSGVHTKMGDYVRGELAAALDKPTITGDAVDHYRRYGRGYPAVAFCVNVAHAEHTAEEFTRAGFASASIDGTMSPAEQARRISAFQTGEIQVLTSCELVSEGFDLQQGNPRALAVGCVISLRPTQSLSLWLQQCGRGSRMSPGQEVCVVLDHAGNTYRHGMPDDDREWTLRSVERRKRTKEVGEERAMALRQCMECYWIGSALTAGPQCPKCGAAWPAPKEPERVEGELQKLTSKVRPVAVRVPLEVISKEQELAMVAAATTLKEMHEVARLVGRSAGWAYIEWKRKSWEPVGAKERQVVTA